MSWKANPPSLVVTVAWSMPVATSVAFTCAFGTELPDGSVTVPLIAPRKVCAFAATPKVKIITTARNNRLILPPPNQFSEKLSAFPPAYLPCRRKPTSANHTPLLQKKPLPKRKSALHLGAPRPYSRQLKKKILLEPIWLDGKDATPKLLALSKL